MKSRLIALVLFSIAFAFVEAAVVFYLRRLLGGEVGLSNATYRELLNLGVIAFIWPDAPIMGSEEVAAVELAREFSTIVMLAAVAFVSGSTFRQVIGGFLVAFSVWDIFYYVFLRVLTGWPAGLLDMDIYFLIPVPWIGPVLTPLVIFTTLLFAGILVYVREPAGAPTRSRE